MYPADQLGVGYQEADLPDEVRITIAGEGGDSRIATRSGSEYSYGRYGAIANLKLGVEGGAWVFIPNADNLSAYVQPCLNDEEAEFTVEDTFADTYYWENVATGDVSRLNLCYWANLGAQLYYYDGNNSDIEFYYNGPPHRWIFIRPLLQQDEGGGVWEKDDPQNSPAGTYSPSTNVTGNTFAGIGVVTVSET